jgi:hypothetical protein
MTTEEEELARVQREIERLRQEQSILIRQAAMQCTEAHRQNINRERARLTEMEYNLEILRHQGREAPSHNQIPQSTTSTTAIATAQSHSPPPAPTTSTSKSPLPATTSTTDGYHRSKKPIGRASTTRAMAPAL